MLADAFSLVFNLTFLVAMGFLSGFIRQRHLSRGRGERLQGLLFGVSSVVGMMHPLVLGSGLIFDGRSVMLSLCGLFFGPAAAGVAAGMALAYRCFAVGGPGVYTGGLVIATSAALGVLCHYRWPRRGEPINAGRLLGLGLSVHVSMILLMFTLPGGTALAVIRHIGLPVLLAYPLATLMMGKILSIHESAERFLRDLNQEKAQVRTLIDTIPDLIWFKDPFGTYLACNRRFEQLFGAKEKEIVGKMDKDFVAEDLAAFFRAHDMKALAAGMPTTNEERVTFRSDGHEEVLETIKTPVFSEDRRILGVLGIGRDITERILREREMESANRLYDMLSQIGRALLHAETREELFLGICNIAVERGAFKLAWIGILDPETSRVTPTAMAGKAVAYLEGISIYGNDRPEGRGPAGICIREDRIHVCPDFQTAPEMQFWRAKAASFGLRSSVALPIHLQGRVVGVLNVYAETAGAFPGRDIALLEEATSHLSFGLEHLAAQEKQKQLQAELSQASKFESLGSLAGGIAHDMNNVLGAILGLASAHLATLPTDNPLQPSLETIRAAATRGGDMVRRLLAFSRQTPREMDELDLNGLLLEQAKLLERTTLAKVHLEMNLAPDLHHILGDGSALTHALMNLCVNAVDAMNDGGTLTFHTRNLGPEQIEVTVEDNGCGMTREVLRKAMDPFFTTKALGKGTGLGLSLVFTTVNAHGGHLRLDSEAGRGTRVVMTFPATVTPGPGPREEAPRSAETGGHPLRVLLVDDDELIQVSTRMLVELLGHTFAMAASGEAALELLEQGFQADAVILDMNMPGLGGKGTLPRLRDLRPRMPVLLATGRADQEALELVASQPLVTLMSKPFSFDELRGHLQRISPEGGG